MRCIMILMYVFSVILPMIGLVRALGYATKRQRAVATPEGVSKIAYGGFLGKVEDATTDAARNKTDAIVNLLFIGVGLGLGGAASIWALFI